MKKKKTSPLKINQALIENYKGVNKYTRTGGGTRIPEMGVEGVDAMFKPMARTGAFGLTKSYLGVEEKKEENKQENTDPNTIKSLEAQIAKLLQQQRQQDNMVGFFPGASGRPGRCRGVLRKYRNIVRLQLLERMCCLA